VKEFLSKISLFSHLSPQEYSFLEREATVKDFKKSELICEAGDSTEYLFLLQSGSVKLYNKKGGKQEIVCLIQPNEFFCLAPLLTRPTHHINAKAMGDSTVVTIPKSAITHLIDQSHEFAKRVIKFLACKECDLCEEVCDLSLSTTKERLAKYLLKEFKKNPERQSFSLPINQSQLASHLGTVRETLSRDLSDLRKARVIESRAGKVKVIKPDELLQIASAD
jgi:CRP-like cAMP-binding protein